MNIYEKLAIIQQELKAPKDQYNSFRQVQLPQLRGYSGSCKTFIKQDENRLDYVRQNCGGRRKKLTLRRR